MSRCLCQLIQIQHEILHQMKLFQTPGHACIENDQEKNSPTPVWWWVLMKERKIFVWWSMSGYLCPLIQMLHKILHQIKIFLSPGHASYWEWSRKGIDRRVYVDEYNRCNFGKENGLFMTLFHYNLLRLRIFNGY